MFKKEHIFFFLLLVSFLWGCQSKPTLPKPKAQLSLSYAKPHYTLLNSPCDFTFEYNDLAETNINEKCWATINYPQLNASIDITYKPVKNDLKILLQDAEKLTYSHTIKADEITNQPYINPTKKVFATLYKVTGNAASQLQFHATDSVAHFLTGAVYFNATPNYDSIYPAVNYLETEVKHILESLSWKE
jgi:gliding motility-associated lipoprotein GldD